MHFDVHTLPIMYSAIQNIYFSLWIKSWAWAMDFVVFQRINKDSVVDWVEMESEIGHEDAEFKHPGRRRIVIIIIIIVHDQCSSQREMVICMDTSLQGQTRAYEWFMTAYKVLWERSRLCALREVDCAHSERSTRQVRSPTTQPQVQVITTW